MRNNKQHAGTVFETALDACKTAYAAGMPILYLLTEEIGLADKIADSNRLVAKRALIKLEDGARQFVPYGEYERYQRGLDEAMGIDPGVSYVPSTVNFAEGKSCWDALVTGDVLAHNIPSIGVIKNFNLYAEAVGLPALGELMARYVQRYLAADGNSACRKAVLLLSAPVLVLPRGLEPYVEVIDIPPPGDGEIRQILLEACGERESPSGEYLGRLTEHLRGFGESQIRTLLRKILVETDFFTNSAKLADLKRKGRPAALPADRLPETVALRLITGEKEQMLKKSGVLSWQKREPVEVGGLEVLVRWLEDKRPLLENLGEASGQWGIEFSKGVLVCGVPGSGKSLMAKKAAEILDVPLIKMDMGALLGKYVGESEQNMRRALATAEAMSPCVLWIDELEKAFSGVSSGSQDNASTKRSFATFLSWMQENRAPCFLFATANDIRGLPPEFLRRGRFDQKFFVFMPRREECVQIFQAELRKRKRQVDAQAGESRIPFVDDGLLTDDIFWGEMVDLFVAERDGARLGKFLTGADISGIVNDLLLRVYREGLPPQAQVRVGREQIRRHLEALSLAAQTYGETDLRSVAECYIRLWEKRFLPASQNVLIDYREFDDRRKPAIAAERDRSSGNYDDILFNSLRDEINRMRG